MSSLNNMMSLHHIARARARVLRNADTFDKSTTTRINDLYERAHFTEFFSGEDMLLVEMINGDSKCNSRTLTLNSVKQ